MIEDFLSKVKLYKDPENMAADFLAAYFDKFSIEYPLNPFQMLKDMDILFSIRDFNKLEGLYIPAQSENDIPIVGINLRRPITRQRFTAAHELCHHFRDRDRQIMCPIGRKDDGERFADSFASAVLMPYQKLKEKIDEYKDETGEVDLEAVLFIADYFGVSLEACAIRIAYTMHSLKGNTEWKELKKRLNKFKPEKKREQLGLTYVSLYCDLLDSYEESLKFIPDEHSRLVFTNQYIYNDSRMEGLDVTMEQASEIVTDLRMNMQNSKYCNEANEAYMSIAGHYLMYQHILENPVKDRLSVYDILNLNKDLYHYYPYPEFGGEFRKENPIVTGAKFEVIDYNLIFQKLNEVEEDIKKYYQNRDKIKISDYIKHVVRTHHLMTMIHPFADGNGRSTRAFMNVQLVRAGLSPLYILVEEKSDYVKALEIADTEGNYDPLYEVIIKVILRCNSEIC